MVALHGVLDLLLSKIDNQRVILRMCILSLYHVQFNLVRRVLYVMYLQLSPVGDRVMSDAVGTVSSCQGMEEDFMIFMARRGPLDTQPLGQDILFDNLRNLYVMATRAHCN